MLALESVIVDRLRQSLPANASWSVKGHTTDTGDRRASGGPLAVVMFAAAAVASQRTTAALVQPGFMVTLVMRRGADAAQALDAAFAAAVQSMHNWAPGEVAGRAWEPLKLDRVQPPQYVDEGLTGLELLFVSSGLFHGQP